MIEAVVVISIFILFFLGMTYFRSMYQNKLHVQRLARAAAVAYALDACQGDPLGAIKADLGTATDNGSGQQQGGANTSGMTSQSTPVGNGDPSAKALGDEGVVGDPIAGINVQAPASGTSKPSPWASEIGFRATVSSNAYMSCGEKQEDGDVGGAFKYIKGLITGGGF